MLLHVKVSGNLLRIFKKLKHSWCENLCDCRALFGISTKNKYVDLELDFVNMWLGSLLTVCGEVSCTFQ